MTVTLQDTRFSQPLAEKNTNTVTLNTLPWDIVHLCFSYLDNKDFQSTVILNSYWKERTLKFVNIYVSQSKLLFFKLITENIKNSDALNMLKQLEDKFKYDDFKPLIELSDLNIKLLKDVINNREYFKESLVPGLYVPISSCWHINSTLDLENFKRETNMMQFNEIFILFAAYIETYRKSHHHKIVNIFIENFSKTDINLALKFIEIIPDDNESKQQSLKKMMEIYIEREDFDKARNFIERMPGRNDKTAALCFAVKHLKKINKIDLAIAFALLISKRNVKSKQIHDIVLKLLDKNQIDKAIHYAALLKNNEIFDNVYTPHALIRIAKLLEAESLDEIKRHIPLMDNFMKEAIIFSFIIYNFLSKDEINKAIECLSAIEDDKWKCSILYKIIRTCISGGELQFAIKYTLILPDLKLKIAKLVTAIAAVAIGYLVVQSPHILIPAFHFFSVNMIAISALALAVAVIGIAYFLNKKTLT